MSTKIYNGYALSLLTLKQLCVWTNQLRGHIEIAADNKYKKRRMQLAVEILDHHTMGNLKPGIPYEGVTWENKSPWWIAFEISESNYRRVIKERTRSPEDDYSFSIQLIPTDTKILVLLYCEDKRYTDIFESMPSIHPYPYWNNTDRPDELTDEQWELRGKEWDNALGNDPPARHGFAVECVADYLLPKSFSEVKDEEFPIFQSRVVNMARVKMSNDYIAKNFKSEDGTDGFMNALRTFRNYEDTSEYQHDFVQARDMIQTTLIKDLRTALVTKLT